MYLTRLFTLLEQVVNCLWGIERSLRVANTIAAAQLGNSPLRYGTKEVLNHLQSEVQKIGEERPPYGDAH